MTQVDFRIYPMEDKPRNSFERDLFGADSPSYKPPHKLIIIRNNPVTIPFDELLLLKIRDPKAYYKSKVDLRFPSLMMENYARLTLIL